MNITEPTELRDRLTAAAGLFEPSDGLREHSARRMAQRRTRSLVAGGLAAGLVVVGLTGSALYALNGGVEHRTVSSATSPSIPSTVPTPSSTTAAPTTAPAPATTTPPPAPVVPTARIANLRQQNPALHLTVDLPYVQLDGVNPAVADGVNRALRAPAEQAVTAFEQKVTGWGLSPDVNPTLSADPGSSMPGIPAATGDAATVTFLNEHYVSVRYAYEASPGASGGHSNTQFAGVTVDLHTGNVVDPRTFLGSDNVAITKSVVDAFVKELVGTQPVLISKQPGEPIVDPADGWPFVTSPGNEATVNIAPAGLVVSVDSGVVTAENGGVRGPAVTVPWDQLPLSPLGRELLGR